MGRGVVSLRRIKGADGGVALRDVTVRYGRRIALEAVSGEFISGSLTAVVGANGAGKSTLLAAIAGVVRLARAIGELSLGELQRALFARVIVQDAAIILLDEPFAAVDAQSLSVLLDQVTRWHQEGRTVIVVLHDLNLVRAHFPSTLVLARRCLAWGTTEVALPAMTA